MTTTTIVHYSTGDPKAVAKKLKPSVVGVTAVVATTKTQIFQSIGTGVVYSATTSYGYIITNNHVIIRDDGTPAKRIRVTLPSGSSVSATLVGRDPTTDIAVLKVKGFWDLVTVVGSATYFNPGMPRGCTTNRSSMEPHTAPTRQPAAPSARRTG